MSVLCITKRALTRMLIVKIHSVLMSVFATKVSLCTMTIVMVRRRNIFYILKLITIKAINLKCSLDINECHTKANSCDLTTQICINTLGSFICECKDGLTGLFYNGLIYCSSDYVTFFTFYLYYFYFSL